MKALPYLASLLVLFASTELCARDSTVPVEGLHEYTPRAHAFVNATVVTEPGNTLPGATVVIRDGLIEAVGSNIEAPADARIWDASGKTIYAGFIDAYSHYGMPDGLKPIVRKPRKPGAPPEKTAPTPDTSGPAHWNPFVTPERQAADYFETKPDQESSLNDLGFTAAASYPGRGIFRGSGMLVNLNGKRIHDSAVDLSMGQHIAFERAIRPLRVYPSSLMGSIALIRQTLYDAQWQIDSAAHYQQSPDATERPEANAALDAASMVLNQGQLALFRSEDELDYQRIQAIASEFDLRAAILGNGYEYRRATILKDGGNPVILPLQFPPPPHVEHPDSALDYSLEQLQHWELAPSNPAFLEKHGIPFCLSAHFTQDPKKAFWPAMRLAVERGLSPETALASITTRVAALYSQEDRLGTIETGKIANLVVATSDLFADENAEIALVIIDGDPIEKPAWKSQKLNGHWSFDWEGIDAFAEGTFKTADDKVTLTLDGTKSLGTMTENRLDLFIEFPNTKGVTRLDGRLDGQTLQGSGELPNGTPIAWSATFLKPVEPDETTETPTDKEPPPDLEFNQYPAGAYGVRKTSHPSIVFIKDATIWTSGPQGVLTNADMLVRDGRIEKVGKKLTPPRDAFVIHADGKHLTPGLIDCHSHIAIQKGVNEGQSASSVEVRIGDVVNPVDISLYRQLAGGVTTSNLLHGSANPMGGQSQVIKLRWGDDAAGLKFQGAKPSVKFALGENVKQSNWGDRFTSRYPQTRMGVEQFMESNFRAAQDYAHDWDAYESGERLMPPRKDLRMEATLEILKGERSIHIHSYRQDEILTFARLAERLDLDVAAFQHILEGYKVADVLASINAGGSTFSDWWSYKFEVYDAIPYNGAIMHAANVVTSFNSDDAELGTRLNTEAAKAVKYGGLSEEDALKFVTLNPAIQLRVEDKVGSLEKGKDADFVLWSDHPLSTFAHAEQTWIDGQKRFDKSEDRKRFKADSEERKRLVQKALKARLKEMKLSPKNKNPDSKDPEELPHDDHPWIYHDGTHHYSCSGLEEHVH